MNSREYLTYKMIQEQAAQKKTAQSTGGDGDVAGFIAFMFCFVGAILIYILGG